MVYDEKFRNKKNQFDCEKKLTSHSTDKTTEQRYAETISRNW